MHQAGKAIDAGLRLGLGRRRLIEIARVEGLDRAAAESLLEERVIVLEKESESWPSPTDVDRLRAAHARLSRRGILGIEFLGEDWEIHDHREALEHTLSFGGAFHGFVFVHGEDRFRMIEARAALISFGASSPAAAREVAQVATDVFAAEGFHPEWDGEPTSAIRIEPFDWHDRMAPLLGYSAQGPRFR